MRDAPVQGGSQNRINAREARVFWLALTIVPVVWALFFLAALFSFSFKCHARIYASGSVSFPRATPAYMRASVRVLNFAPYSVIDDRKYFVFGTEIFGRFRRFS
ncbi:hypothetical protein J6590_097960 [Homalodisca vitripennis]|nr:hypothetical protein J6590_097960 [Homalodisca vitripennis]